MLTRFCITGHKTGTKNFPQEFSNDILSIHMKSTIFHCSSINKLKSVDNDDVNSLLFLFLISRLPTNILFMFKQLLALSSTNINSSKLYLKSFYWNCSQISIPWLEEEKNNNKICIKSNRTTMINALGLIIFHPCQVMQRFRQQCQYVFNPKQISQEVCTEQGIYLHSSPNYQFIM